MDPPERGRARAAAGRAHGRTAGGGAVLRRRVAPSRTPSVGLEPAFAVLVVVAGSGRLATDAGELELARGDTVLIPYAAGAGELTGAVEAIRCLPPYPGAHRMTTADPARNDFDPGAAAAAKRGRAQQALLALSNSWLFAFLLLLIGWFWLTTPPDTFLSHSNLTQIGLSTSEVVLLAIGQTFVIVTAGIDLSIGGILFLSGVCGGEVMLQALRDDTSRS